MGFQLEFIFVFAILLRKGDAFWTAGQSKEIIFIFEKFIIIFKSNFFAKMIV